MKARCLREAKYKLLQRTEGRASATSPSCAGPPPFHLHVVSHYCFRKISFAHIGQPPLALVPIVGSNMLVVAGCVLVIDVLVVIQQRGETMDERGQLAGARRYY